MTLWLFDRQAIVEPAKTRLRLMLVRLVVEVQPDFVVFVELHQRSVVLPSADLVD